MRALAYLLGARALDTSRESENAIRRPSPEVPLAPLATTEATAAAWRRWRDRTELDAAPPSADRVPSMLPKRA